MKSATPDPNLTKKTDSSGKSEPLSSVLHLVEALALVMLCNYRFVSIKLLSNHYNQPHNCVA